LQACAGHVAGPGEAVATGRRCRPRQHQAQ
jgi:hypothetical protein